VASDGVATVLDSERTTEDGAHVVDVKADLGGGDNVTLDHFAPPGVDALPLPGDAAAIGDGAGTGRAQATGYNDPKNAGRAKPGELRVYGRDPDGNIVNEVWLQGSGEVLIENAEGTFHMAVDGKVTINGVTIDTQGNITAPGEVTAKGGTPVPVNLSTHLHPTGTGPSGPPQPGT
jgi:hypothetical protein